MKDNFPQISIYTTHVTLKDASETYTNTVANIYCRDLIGEMVEFQRDKTNKKDPQMDTTTLRKWKNEFNSGEEPFPKIFSPIPDPNEST